MDLDVDGVEDVHERFVGPILTANAARNTTQSVLIPLSQVYQDLLHGCLEIDGIDLTDYFSCRLILCS